jgi:hypothetical protein
VEVEDAVGKELGENNDVRDSERREKERGYLE